MKLVQVSYVVYFKRLYILKYCKTYYLALFVVKANIAEILDSEIQLEFSYTISNKWTHVHCMLISYQQANLNGGVCFHAEKATSLKGLLLNEEYAPYWSIFFPLRVVSMRI